jgi:NMD protein affecting ribosome stability and mRNA decay
MPKVEPGEIVELKGAQLQVTEIDDREMTLKLLSRVEREQSLSDFAQNRDFPDLSAEESRRHLERVIERQRHRGKPRKGRR